MDFSDNRDTLAGEKHKERFFAGVPNIPNKDKDKMAVYLMFIQHIIYSMKEHGKAAIVVPTGFLTAGSGIPKKIREHIVKNRMLRGVVSMPSNIFATTGTNVSILFLDKDNQDGKVILMDASKLGTKEKVDGKNQRTVLSKDEIDRIIGGFYFGQVILLTGKRGEGKSTFMSQLIVEALEQGYKTFAYSGELTDYHFKRWLDFQAAGPDNIVSNKDQFGEETYLLTNEVIDKLNNWYRGKAYLYDNSAVIESEELESLLVTIEKAVCRYGIRFVCIDNLMTALDVDMRDDLYRAQLKFLRELKLLAYRHNIVVL